MKVRKAVLLLSVLLSAIPVLAQVDTAWVRRYNGFGSGSDRAEALVVDKSGNVYVTGGANEGEGIGRDYVTIKYAPNGETLWLKKYNGPGNFDDGANALAVDDSGYVYVTGYNEGIGSSWDYTTIKYSPNGDTLWLRRYNGPANGIDIPFDLTVDDSGNVYVTGYSQEIGLINDDFATIKYAPNGDTLWVRRYNGSLDTTRSLDIARALGVDRKGNVYVTGESSIETGQNFTTIKYSPNGDTLWVRRYFGVRPQNLALDGEGNVYVTGTANTIKYLPNGDIAWVRSFDITGASIALNDSGHVYTTGYITSDGFVPKYDYATVKYAPNGDTLWIRTYSGPTNWNDIAASLAIDKNGNVYVTGWSDGASSINHDYATIKYSPHGEVLWVSRYNGPGDSYDYAKALALDDSGNVYVTGLSVGNGTGYDYATIKYIQFDCTALSGDADADDTLFLSDIVTLINFLFKSQPAPNPFCRGDANADGKVLLSDIVYLINFLFKSGPAPQKNRECCL